MGKDTVIKAIPYATDVYGCDKERIVGDDNVGETRFLEEHDDDQAIRVFREGNPEGFDHLLRKYRLQVYRICYRFTGNHHDADDQAQEVFLRVFRGLARFRGQSRFSTWVYRIAVNTCLNWVATRKKATEPLPENMADPSPGQAESLAQAERSRAVREAVDRLPPKQRMTLVLRAFHGLTHREISEVMEKPVGTVKANFFFALQNLRKNLEEVGLTEHRDE
jgi:RNA polymerase sigma-70 factor (ECF subfamily)